MNDVEWVDSKLGREEKMVDRESALVVKKEEDVMVMEDRKWCEEEEENLE